LFPYRQQKNGKTLQTVGPKANGKSKKGMLDTKNSKGMQNGSKKRMQGTNAHGQKANAQAQNRSQRKKHGAR
jgi:hypothetical protein